MKNFFLIKTGVLVWSLLFSQFAFAGQAGTVTFKTGDATITRADKTVIKAEKNVALNAGDTVETKDGRLQLSLIDGGKVSLQPNTIYRINKYEFSGKEDGTEYGFTELIKGGLRTISGLIGHKNRDRYQLKTAVATIGIRGTEFTVNFNDNQLLMTTNHGSVDVCNAGGCLNAITGQSIIVNGVGAAPKPSSKAAKAAAAAPAASNKVVFAVSDPVTDTGLPNIIAQAVIPQPAPPTSGTVVSTVVAAGGLPTSTTHVNAAFMYDAQNKLIDATIPNLSVTPDPIAFSSYGSDGIVAWGQTSNGTYDAGNPFAMARYDYIVGAAPIAGSLANLTGTYNVFASTSPFYSFNTVVSTIGSANQVTGTFNFNFPTNSFGYNLNVPTNTFGTFNLTANAINLNPNYTFTGSSIVTNASNSNSCGSPSACTGSVIGSFLGVNGQRIGLQYVISPALGGTMNGGAVLK